MPYTRPALSDIIARVQSDMSARLINGAPVLRRSFLDVLSRVFSGISHMLYGFLVWISKQIIPGSADNDATYLAQHADTWGITRIAATYATGNVTITGTNGSIAPTGSVLQRSDGQQYKTTADATISAGSATVAVHAANAGSISNSAEATPLSFVATISGINQAATVATGGLTGGIDVETDTSLRSRLQARLLVTPQGGSLADYKNWALSVAGVYKAFVFPLYDFDHDAYPALGFVGVTCISSSGIPDGSIITALQAYLQGANLAGVAPVTAIVKAYAPIALNVSFTINLNPNTVAVQNAITAELKALFDREGAPNSTLLLSHIIEAIALAVSALAGPTGDFNLVAPVADVVTSRKYYPIVSTPITFGSI